MKITIERDCLLKPLQAVIGVVERRQTMPILANVLLKAAGGELSLTASDLEVELISETGSVNVEAEGSITVPARKLLDISRALPEKSTIQLELKGDRVSVSSGRSRFVLATLPATDFPVVEDINSDREIRVSKSDLVRVLDKTHFSMAQQDVRYYLNGLLIETDAEKLRAVATDGHRLALSDIALEQASSSKAQVIVPRKGVLELQKILEGEGEVIMLLSSNHLRVEVGEIRLTSKLIDGRFPDYERVIPKEAANLVSGNRAQITQALQRAAILSNEKYRGVRLIFDKNRILIQANNPDQEEAEDQVEVEYSGKQIEIGFNVNYLLDAIAAVDSDNVEISLIDPSSSCIVRTPTDKDSLYVVMPMRL
ncbi:MAG: DNA polymerase III subunit beta [Pseudomonadota bacterium]|nr:DNA polymerase III subunit beta [Pseudomonadota bacterium]